MRPDLASTIIDTPALPEVAPQATRLRIDRVSAALIGALDGLLGVALPFAVLAMVALIAWVGLGTPTDWTAFVRGAADAWLLGHGVDIRFTAGRTTFAVTVAVLGPALVTALCAVRAGRRAAATGAPLLAWAAGALVSAAAGAGLGLVGSSLVAAPSLWQCAAAPGVLVAAAGALGLRTARTGGAAAAMGAGLRAGLGGIALLLGVAGAAVALLLAVHLTDVVGLYETLSAGAAGGFVLTVLQLLLLPTAVVWGAAWFTGAGFVLGTGSVVGPLGTAVGPMPALPLLGALPADPGPFAVAAPLVPVLVGAVIGVLVARHGPVRALRVGAVAGVIAGLGLGLAALATSGAAGPGRFAAVGPDPLLTGVLAALEIGLPAMIGAAIAGRSTRPRAEAPDRAFPAQ